MNTRVGGWGALLSLGLLTACSATPTTITQNQNLPQVAQTTSAPGVPGSIYNAAMGRPPLFLGQRPAKVGDLVTILMEEDTKAAKNGTGKASKKGSGVASGSASDNITTVTSGFNTSNESKYESEANANAKNTFFGEITATVVEVRPNGNLVVSGEKQVALDQGVEFVRVSGVVNPNLINTMNQVKSTTIADARFEYRTNSTFDLASLGNMLNRFFLSVVPF